MGNVKVVLSSKAQQQWGMSFSPDVDVLSTLESTKSATLFVGLSTFPQAFV